MEYELHWDNEVVADDDEKIAMIEAEIAETKAQLAKLSLGDDLF